MTAKKKPTARKPKPAKSDTISREKVLAYLSTLWRSSDRVARGRGWTDELLKRCGDARTLRRVARYIERMP